VRFRPLSWDFLGSIESPVYRDNYINALRTYYRDFLYDPERVRTFRFANIITMPSWCPSKKDFIAFYSELDDPSAFLYPRPSHKLLGQQRQLNDES